MPVNASEPTHQRSRVLAIVLATVVFSVLLILRWSSLDNPPAWDSSVSVFPAAIHLAETNFDFPDLLSQPHSVNGGPNTHSASLVTLVVALLMKAFSPSAATMILHVVNLMLAGVLAGLVFLLTSRFSSVRVGVLAGISSAFLPVVVQQASDIYLDLPLAVAVTAAVLAADSRRPIATTVAVTLAVWIKLSGIFAIPLIYLSLRSLPRGRRVAPTIVGAAVAALPLLPQAFSSILVKETIGSWQVSDVLFRSSGRMLILTPDVLLLLALVPYLMLRARILKGRSFEIERMTLVLIGSFFIVHGYSMMATRGIAILPRYYVALLPVVVASIAILLCRQAERHAIVGLSLLIVFSLLNMRGAFYPVRDHDFFAMAERSTRAEYLIELYQLGANTIVEQEGRVLFVERTMYFRLTYPGMGFVNDTPEGIDFVLTETVDELPDEFAMIIEHPFGALVNVEAKAIAEGWEIERRVLRAGPYTSDLILADRPDSP